MKRIWGHAVSLLVLGVCAGASAPACVENNRSIFIRQVMFPSATRVNGTCSYTADPGQPPLFFGTFDVGVRDNYVAVLLVGNQLRSTADPANATTESNRMYLNGIVSRITDPDGNQIREFTLPASGFADVSVGGGAPGWGLIASPVIDLAGKEALAATVAPGSQRTVVVNIKVFGKTIGNVEVESGEYQFPVRVCNGCLVDFAAGTDPTIQPQPNCERAVTPGGTATEAPCFAGQDEPVPCQLCKDRKACNPLAP